MGLMAPIIDNQQSLKTIASSLAKPWYKKPESWLTIVNIIALIINIAITIYLFLTNAK